MSTAAKFSRLVSTWSHNRAVTPFAVVDAFDALVAEFTTPSGVLAALDAADDGEFVPLSPELVCSAMLFLDNPAVEELPVFTEWNDVADMMLPVAHAARRGMFGCAHVEVLDSIAGSLVAQEAADSVADLLDSAFGTVAALAGEGVVVIAADCDLVPAAPADAPELDPAVVAAEVLDSARRLVDVDSAAVVSLVAAGLWVSPMSLESAAQTAVQWGPWLTPQERAVLVACDDNAEVAAPLLLTAGKVCADTMVAFVLGPDDDGTVRSRTDLRLEVARWVCSTPERFETYLPLLTLDLVDQCERMFEMDSSLCLPLPVRETYRRLFGEWHSSLSELVAASFEVSARPVG